MSKLQISQSRKLLRAGPGHSNLENFGTSASKRKDRFLCKALISEKANFEVWSRANFDKIAYFHVFNHLPEATPHFEVSLLGDEGFT